MKKGLLSLAVLVVFMSVISLGFADDKLNSENRFFTFDEMQEDLDALTSTQAILRKITFRGQFYRFGKIYCPFFTCFTSTNYMNFSAWDFDAPLWEKKAFNDYFPTLYISKFDSKLINSALKLQQFDRFEAVGEIRCSFEGRPWVNITSLKLLDGRNLKNSLQHVYLGFKAKEKGDLLNTAIEFSKAWKKSLPRYTKARIRKEEGTALYKLEDYKGANTSLREAYNFYGKADAEVTKMLAETHAILILKRKLENKEVTEEGVSKPAESASSMEEAVEVESIEIVKPKEDENITEAVQKGDPEKEVIEDPKKESDPK